MSTRESNHLEQENSRLRQAVEELTILNEISSAISSTRTLDEIIELMVHKCVKHLKVEQAAISLLEAGNENKPFRTMVRKGDSSPEVLPFRLDTQLTGWMLKHKRPLLVNDLGSDERFKGLDGGEFPIRSLLSVPLTVKGRIMGIVSVFNKKGETGFSTDGQRLLAIIAAQSAQVLENARLLQEEQHLLRMREEMQTAREIQTRLLPDRAPEIPGYDIAGLSIPAREVGGDYYDFVLTDHGHLAICLGDVTGKGLPAAMLMSNVQATMRSLVLSRQPPEQCIASANRLIFDSTSPNKFVTLFYGILDPVTHHLHYCNAGHDNPIMIDGGGQLRRLEAGGVVLGFVSQFAYTADSREFTPGSRLLIFSDGVSEAMNAAEEAFGEDKLTRILADNPRLSSAELNDTILSAVQAHAGQTPQSDDLTLVTITRIQS